MQIYPDHCPGSRVKVLKWNERCNLGIIVSVKSLYSASIICVMISTCADEPAVNVMSQIQTSMFTVIMKYVFVEITVTFLLLYIYTVYSILYIYIYM